MQHRGPASGCWALLWCLIAQPVCCGARTVFIREGDGLAFAQAVAAFGGDGVDTTIYLPPGRILSVANISFPDAVPVNPSYVPFSSGILTIMPAPSSDSSAGPTILDAAMRYGLPSFGGRPMLFTNTAELHLINITIINMCDLFWSADTRTNLGWDMAFAIGIFPRNRARRTHITTNITFYVRQAEVASLLWYPLGFKSTIPAFRAQASRVVINSPLTPTAYALRDVSPNSLFTPSMLMPAESMVNKTARSTSDPNDPLLNSLRAAGVIMPHQLCKIPNAPVQGPPPGLYEPRAPLSVVSDTPTMLQAIRNAVELNRVNGSINGLPPVVMLVSAATPATLAGYNPLPALVGPLLLTGMLSDVPGVYDWAGIIDFQYQSTPMLPVSQTGSLMLQLMVLQGLPTAPLPGAGTPSALPLSAFPRAQGSDLIAFDSVTLVLPDLDYLALLSLVQPAARCSWNATVQRHAVALAAGISTLGGPRVSPGYGSISLSAFTGWGLNGTNLKLLPDNRDLPAGVAVACGLIDGASLVVGVSANDHKPSAQDAGVIVGCVTAGVLLGAALTMLASYIYTKCRSPRPSQDELGTCAEDTYGSQAPGSAAQCVMGSAEKGGTGSKPGSAQHTAAVDSIFKGLQANSASSDDNGDMFTIPPSAPSQRARQALASAAFQQGPSLRTPMKSAAQAAMHQGRALQPSDVQELVSFCGGTEMVPSGNADKVLVRLPSRHGSGDGAACGATEPGSPYVSLPAGAEQQPDAEQHGRGLTRHTESVQAALQRAEPEATQQDHLLPSDPTQAIKVLLEAMPSDGSTVEVRGLLGQGAWGTVYKGLWRGLHVALKTMVFEVMKNDESAKTTTKEERRHEQALLETAVAASVNHPNVVRTYSYDIKPVGSPKQDARGLQIEHITRAQASRLQTYKLFLIQELCSISLAQALQDGTLHEKGQMREPLLYLYVLLDIARGLEYLHSRKIVHGDLKPENVLLQLADTPIGVICKLADFGFSARLPGNATHVSYFTKGTPFYVAPEVVIEHRASPASDVFSFGVIMWQLYTGESPYQNRPGNRPTWNPLFPNFHPHALPPLVFSQLLCRCFLRDPKQRPTATHLVATIETLITAVSASETCPTMDSSAAAAPAGAQHTYVGNFEQVSSVQGNSINPSDSLHIAAAGHSDGVAFH